MTILQRYRARLDVLHMFGGLIAIFHTRTAAEAFMAGAAASLSNVYQDEAHRRHEA
jgi:hypothetical protein